MPSHFHERAINSFDEMVQYHAEIFREMRLIASGEKQSTDIKIFSDIFRFSEEFQSDFQWICEFSFRIPTFRWILEQQIPIHGHAIGFTPGITLALRIESRNNIKYFFFTYFQVK